MVCGGECPELRCVENEPSPARGDEGDSAKIFQAVRWASNSIKECDGEDLVGKTMYEGAIVLLCGKSRNYAGFQKFF